MSYQAIMLDATDKWNIILQHVNEGNTHEITLVTTILCNNHFYWTIP